MNKLPVYLYSNSLDVILDLDQNKGIHKIMYQRKLKIQKGFKDTVQIQFKNSDQKPVSIAGNDYYLDLLDNEGKQYVLSQSKKLDIVEYVGTDSSIVSKGIATVTFDPFDTVDLQAANYKFVVKKDNGDGTYTPAYSNTYYGITGDLEVVSDGFPTGYPAQTVDMKTLETGKDYDRTFGSMGFIFRTGWLRPLVRSTSTATNSTAAITLAGFVGTITVEGTLDNSPSPAGQANAQTFEITTYTTATATTEIINIDCGSGYTAVRFKVKPAPGPLGTNYYPTGYPIGSQTNKFPSGFIDNILYFS